jgi:ribokinase
VSDRTQALFVGDIGLDTTATVGHVPEPDEKVLASEFAESAGGVVANAAIACRRAGVEVRLLCTTGDDVAAERAVGQLRGAGVVVDTTVVAGATGRAIIVLEPTGEKRLILVPGVSMYPSLEQVRSASLAEVAWVHTAAYDHDTAALLADRCREWDLRWSLDLEPATFDRDPAEIAPVLQGAEVVFVNSRAGRALGADPAGRLFEHGVKTVILSRGPEGAVWVTPTERIVVGVPTHVGRVVDTTGAGDCLAGWFISESLAGSDPTSALETAVAAASISCTRLGAQPSYPDRAELCAFADLDRDQKRQLP